jgi:lambda family phage portal protein
MFDRLRGAVRGAARAFALSDGLESGRMSRRMSSWVPSRVHVNTLVASSGATTLARARYLVRNNPYALGATECFTANLIGSGITPSWNFPTEQAELKTKIEKAWLAWTDEADSEGVTDLYGLQRRIGRELFIAGECFIRRRPRYLRDGLTVPLQLQLLPAEMCPIERNLTLENGNVIRQGIEFNAIGKRIAYHFWRVHPGDVTQSLHFGETTIVAADDVLHIHDPIEAGQIRGLPRLTASIVPLWALDGYDDAEMERKKTAALFGLFVKRPDPDGTLFDQAAEDKAKEGDGVATIKLEPGSAQVLLPGEEIQTAAPADVGPNYEAFQYRMLMRICSSLGLPYASVTGDMVRANYSNQRAALLEMRRRMEALQFGVMVYQACRPLARWFLDAADLAGTINLAGYEKDPSPYLDVKWIPPNWAWVDPLKDVQAAAIAVDNCFASRSSIIREGGNDPVQVDEEIAADQQRLRDKGIVLRGSGTPISQDVPPPDENQQTDENSDNQDASPDGETGAKT